MLAEGVRGTNELKPARESHRCEATVSLFRSYIELDLIQYGLKIINRHSTA